jgi:lipooligosaccharide transport system ATP-binding protein
MNVVEVRNLVKRYGSFEAVSGISFDVSAGECYGLLGPNGAGKTTTMSVIRCVSPSTSGTLTVLGMDGQQHGRRIRAKLGVVPQHDSLDPDLSVLDNLVVHAGYFGIRGALAKQRALDLLRFMALEEKARVRIDQLSGGLRRRLLIARGLINVPELMILDEPTTGLDPQARHHIWLKLRTLKNDGTPMVLCTHSMDEAERLCDRISILDHGKLLIEGRPTDLIREHAGKEVLEIINPQGNFKNAFESMQQKVLAGGFACELHEDTMTCYSKEDISIPTTFLDEARSNNLSVTSRRATLEDVFLRLTGRELRE